MKGIKGEIPGKRIFLADLVEMFDSMREESNWDIDETMLWGYFFTHHEPKNLEKAGNKLVRQGYRFVDIYLSDKDDENEPDIYWLHVEKMEAHSPETLDRLNDELCMFAYENGLDSYDGMDVGPIEED